MPRMTRTYPLKFEPDDNNTIVVTCPDLPDFVTYGSSEADAVRRARDGIRAVAMLRVGRGLTMPLGRRPAPGQPVTTVKIDT